MVQAVVDIAGGSSKSYALLSGEPGGRVLFFARNAADVDVQFVNFADTVHEEHRWSGGRLVRTCRVELGDLVAATRAMLDDLLHDPGRDEYERRWGFSFPDELALALRSHAD